MDLVADLRFQHSLSVQNSTLGDNVGVMVPYFAMLLLACIFGTFGNVLVISAILSFKVRIPLLKIVSHVSVRSESSSNMN